LSVPTRAAREAGGFDPSLRRGEDVEFAFRLIKSGIALTYLENAIAFQDFRKTTSQCLRDAETEGETAIQLARLHPDMLPFLPLGKTRISSLVAPILNFSVSMPVPMVLFEAAGRLPAEFPGARTLFRAMHAYWYFRGVRRAAGRIPATVSRS
jgi:hypothetical protein